MKSIKIFIHILLSLCLFNEIAIAEKAKTNTKKELLKKNTPFDIYELKGKQNGTTLLVIGGIHGDEPGGFFTPALLVNFYQIKKGKVIVVPNLNPDSILAFRRGVYKDMNRKFATIKVWTLFVWQWNPNLQRLHCLKFFGQSHKFVPKL